MCKSYEITLKADDCKYCECSYYEHDTGYCEYECTVGQDVGLDNTDCFYGYCPYTCTATVTDDFEGGV